MKTKIAAHFLLLSCSVFAAAEGTKTWIQTSYDEFSRGTAKGVSLRSDGAIEVAPVFINVFTTPSTFVWAAVSDRDGNVYLGSGAPARVYRITPDGKATVIFEPKELQVQALAIDGDTIYAATSPDGKVYKIERTKSNAANDRRMEKPGDDKAANVKDENAATINVPVDPNYTSTVFFDPSTKYIWAMAFDAAGRGELYVATGDRGEIYRVPRSGNGSVFFKSDEAHIRTLAVKANGDLIAGSDGSGLVYRISPNGEGFVLYSAPKKEITALAIDADGNIYAAGVGEKRVAPTASPQPSQFTPPSTVPGATPPPPSPNINPLTSSGGSEVYQIASDGSPRRLWGAKDDIVYALAFDPRGRLIAGTGNKGRVIAIESNGDFIDLVKASASQVTAFAPAKDGAIYAAASNLGKVFRMSSALENEGTLESEVFDAKIFSRWGRADVRGTGSFELMARSGNVDNPDRNWSAWKKVDLSKQSMVEAPAGRFVQWRIALKPEGSKNAARTRIDNVRLFYRPQNVAPVVEDIAVQAGARVTSTSIPRSTSETVTINLGSSPAMINPSASRVEGPITAQRDRGSVTVRWSARDDNDDDLLYSIYYRGDGETKWKLLKENITEKVYSWDAGLLPDGGYTVRVVATDAPSHTPDEALSDSRESKRFEIDTTAPRIDGLSAKLENGQLLVTFNANDTFSNIQRAEFSLDAGDWQFVEPVGQLSDAPSETYDFTVPLLAAEPVLASRAKRPRNTNGHGETDATSTEHVIVVRVYDRFDNVGTAKVVVK
jgi:hypothetical protein